MTDGLRLRRGGGGSVSLWSGRQAAVETASSWASQPQGAVQQSWVQLPAPWGCVGSGGFLHSGYQPAPQLGQGAPSYFQLCGLFPPALWASAPSHQGGGTQWPPSLALRNGVLRLSPKALTCFPGHPGPTPSPLLSELSPELFLKFPSHQSWFLAYTSKLSSLYPLPSSKTAFTFLGICNSILFLGTNFCLSQFGLL